MCWLCSFDDANIETNINIYIDINVNINLIK